MNAKTTNKKPLLSDGWENYYADPAPGKKDDEILTRYCGKCGGTGHIQYYAFIDSGRCWDCDATGGKHTVSVGSLRSRAEANAKNAARKANKALRIEQKGLAWLKGREVEEAFAWGRKNDNTFIQDVYFRLLAKGEISEKQEAAVVKSWKRAIEAEQAEAAREKVPAPEGRMTVEGMVVSIKEQANYFSYRETYDYKMLVTTDEGWKTWGTVPASILSEVKKGDKVTFTATIKPSEDDIEFSYFSRPSKAAIISVSTTD